MNNGTRNAIAEIIRDGGLLWLVKCVNRVLRWLTSMTHRAQLVLEWRIYPNPEWFDHFIDQHEQWYRTRVPFCWERGIFNLLAIRSGARVLELCCGDGFNAYHFYSVRAASVASIDFDPKAIAHARANFKAPNVTYTAGDIRYQIPVGPFDNVLWDAAIEHFTEKEISDLMATIRARLVAGGILSGYTMLEEAVKQHHEHEYEFKSKEDLARFLTPHFKNVLVFQTDYPKRRNLYFFASDGKLPFDSGWAHQFRTVPDA